MIHSATSSRSRTAQTPAPESAAWRPTDLDHSSETRCSGEAPNAAARREPANFYGHVLHVCGSGYSPHMLAKWNLIKPLVVGGAVAAAIAVTPVAAAEAFAGGTATTGSAATHVVFKQDPGGSGCDANGNCGSGGQNGGPGGGPGGQGCVPGVGCGSGGQFAGPGGVPGGTGCLPGVGCGSGHG